MTERRLKALVLLYLFSSFVGSFLCMALLQSGALNGIIPNASIDRAGYYPHYAFAGAIGGSLYCLRLFYWHNIRGSLNIYKWWIWYFLRPVMSSGTAVMTVILFRSGILLLDIRQDPLSAIGLAFLIGYGFGKVMDKLDGLTETLFNGQPDPGKRPGAPVKGLPAETPDSDRAKGANGSNDPDQPIRQLKQ